MMKGIASVFNYAIGIVLLLGFWQYLSSVYPPAIIPSLESAGKAMIEVLRNESLLSEAMYSFYRVLVASLISVLGGIALGILGGSRPFFYRGALSCIHCV